MHELNLKDKLQFDATNLVNPDKVIADIGFQLESVTKGLVKGIVNTYDGPIESYSALTGMASLVLALGGSQEHNIQDDLGAIDYQPFKFEFYLTATKTENYKFRVMFFEYELGGYPVKIVLEQGIADEIYNKENADYIFEIQTKEELEEITNRILNSTPVIKVIQGLINVSLSMDG